jgi:hypothetical protein
MTETAKVDLELEGSVHIVERDEDGNEISREKLDGELVLKALVSVLSDAVNAYAQLEGDEEEKVLDEIAEDLKAKQASETTP